LSRNKIKNALKINRYNVLKVLLATPPTSFSIYPISPLYGLGSIGLWTKTKPFIRFAMRPYFCYFYYVNV